MKDEHDDFMEVVNLDKLVEFSRQLIFYNFAIEDEDDETDDEFISKVKNIKKEDKEEMSQQEELSKPAAEGIKHSPENVQEKLGVKFAVNSNQNTTYGRVLNAISNNN